MAIWNSRSGSGGKRVTTVLWRRPQDHLMMSRMKSCPARNPVSTAVIGFGSPVAPGTPEAGTEYSLCAKLPGPAKGESVGESWANSHPNSWPGFA